VGLWQAQFGQNAAECRAWILDHPGNGIRAGSRHASMPHALARVQERNNNGIESRSRSARSKAGPKDCREEPGCRTTQGVYSLRAGVTPGEVAPYPALKPEGFRFSGA
jgi:hypothetical protein